MEYPKTIGELLDKIQCCWKEEGTEVSFCIKDMNIVNAVGFKDSHGNSGYDMAFSIRKAPTGELWQISCGDFGWDRANIVEWKDGIFATSEFEMIINEPNIHPKIEPTIRRFIQVQPSI